MRFSPISRDLDETSYSGTPSRRNIRVPHNYRKLISLYVKGGNHDAGYYYRFHQYYRELKVEVKLHKMYSDWVYKKLLPASTKPFVVQGLLWIYSSIRVFLQLLEDFILPPDTLVISRRLVSRWMPSPYRWILEIIAHKGVNIIWDFDDNICESRECDKESFRLFTRISSHIIIASPYLQNLIPVDAHNKVVYLPSTDGDLYGLLTTSVCKERIDAYSEELRLIWLGTQVSLKYVEEILPLLSKAGEYLKKYEKKLVLTVVCDKPLKGKSNTVEIHNVRWTRDVAFSELKESHVGIMPLEVNKFTAGKGGFKLIQYLSIGLPVIATGVGVNKEIVDNEVGYLVSDLKDTKWIEYILDIGLNSEKWMMLSEKARRRYKDKYSFEENLKVWRDLL